MEPRLKSAAWLIVLGSFALAAVGLWPRQTGRQEEFAQGMQAANSAVDQPLAPAWAVDPRGAGESLPPVGRSLFDFLVRDGGVARVPFPFEALTREIDSRLGCAGLSRAAPKGRSNSAVETSCFKRVLIPLGRSLQRSAPAPEFFKYPRVVVAVESEPPAP